MKKRERGFTLIELLVVIAIIAILAAILFPVFLRAKQAGQAAACLGNVKQLALAQIMYSDNNNGAMVPTVAEPDGRTVGVAGYLAAYRTWRALLWQYVRNEGAYYCPSMRQEARMWQGWDQVPYSSLQPHINDVPSTYAINNKVSANASWAQGNYTYKLSAYPRPSRIILLTEIRQGLWNTNDGIMDKSNKDNTSKPIWDYAPRFHYNRLNVSFIDGHAKTMYLYDTIGDSASGWMWWDPVVQANAPDCGGIGAIETRQNVVRRQWPKNYPPFGM